MEQEKKLETKKFFDDEKIETLLSPTNELELKVDRALADIDSNNNFLVVSDESNYSIAALTILKKMSKPDSLLIYVTVNKSAEKMIRTFENKKIEIKNLKLIDMVTLQVGAKKLEHEYISYISSTSSLIELMEEVEKNLEVKNFDKKILIFDSISTLLVYNEISSVEKLIHSIIGKFDKNNVSGIFLITRTKDHTDLIRTISQFCDKVIEI